MNGWLKKLLGNRGEQLAARYLKRQGYKILKRGAASRWGEIDIIATEGDSIVFIEVKTRSSVAAGHPTEAITPDKQRRLTRAALAYLKKHKLLEHRARFDVVAILSPAGAATPEIVLYRNAFEPTGFGQMYS